MGYFFLGGFQPGTDTCLARDRVSWPAGVLRLIVDPAPM